MATEDDTANDTKAKTTLAIEYFVANQHHGVTVNAAAKKFGISAAGVYRRIKAIQAAVNGICPTCGQPVKI